MNLIGINEKYNPHAFPGGWNAMITCYFQAKIVIPQALQKQMINWYHLHLCHPGTRYNTYQQSNNTPTGKPYERM
jgi:hypothetical protein